MGMKSILESFKERVGYEPPSALRYMIKTQYPEALDVMKEIGNPQIRVFNKSGSRPNSFISDDDVHIITNEDRSLSDDADMAYVAMIGLYETYGERRDDLTQRRIEISERLFLDENNDPTRFLVSDIRNGYDTGGNAQILKGAIEALDSICFSEASEILSALEDGNVVMRVSPTHGDQAMVARFWPQRNEMHVSYDPNAETQSQLARVALRLLHEGCHHIQCRDGMSADIAKEARNFRELTHLNELQAHTIPAKVVMTLFHETGLLEGYLDGSLSKEDLGEMWRTSDNIEDQMCLAYLIEHDDGNVLLDNIKTRYDADDFDLENIEFFIKEALTRGRIVSVDDDAFHFDEDNLSRMQRYAHAHIVNANFSHFKKVTERPKDDVDLIDNAVKLHFNGPLGLGLDGNTVTRAAEELRFRSSISGREVSVGQIENMWERDGCTVTEGFGDYVLSFAAEDVKKISFPYGQAEQDDTLSL